MGMRVLLRGDGVQVRCRCGAGAGWRDVMGTAGARREAAAGGCAGWGTRGRVRVRDENAGRRPAAGRGPCAAPWHRPRAAPRLRWRRRGRGAAARAAAWGRRARGALGPRGWPPGRGGRALARGARVKLHRTCKRNSPFQSGREPCSRRSAPGSPPRQSGVSAGPGAPEAQAPAAGGSPGAEGRAGRRRLRPPQTGSGGPGRSEPEPEPRCPFAAPGLLEFFRESWGSDGSGRARERGSGNFLENFGNN